MWQVGHGFILKMNQLILMLALRTLMFLILLLSEANLLAITVGNGANGIVGSMAIAVPLKYLSNFGRSLEMPLINCKVELKLYWTKYCVLDSGGTETSDTNLNNIIFTIKETKLSAPAWSLY